jgi:hypothetical protein
VSHLARFIGRAVVACVLIAAAAPQAASAAQATLAISTLSPEVLLEESGASKLELNFTNLTMAPAVLEAKAEGHGGAGRQRQSPANGDGRSQSAPFPQRPDLEHR